MPYARTLGGGTLTVGLLMAAMPAGAVIGTLALTRLVSPPDRMKPLVEMALLSCVPLIFCAFHPPLWAVLSLWALAGAGTCYQLAALTAFIRVQAGPGALAFAQAGLLAAQCAGFVIAGAAAQLVGAPTAVALAGLCGMAAVTALARSWGRASRSCSC